MAMYDRRLDRIVGAADIYNADSGPYFRDAGARGLRGRPDARHHPATVGFLDNYLLPLDLHSLLDVCFSINGVPFGSFSCEQAARR